MALLHFDATKVPPARPIELTFGRSRSEFRWTDRRAMSFEDLADLLSHSEIGRKDGSCFTPATFTGAVRRKDQAARIDAVVLDADCGHTLKEIEASIRAQGWRAVIHSTHSHLSEQTAIAAGAYDKWLADNAGGVPEDFMRAKKGYLPRVVAGAQIVDEIREEGSRFYMIRHRPCPKFRIVLPLIEPWVAEDYQSQDIANATWKERIGALAHALGLHHDQSCVDTSRLFYLPRHREGQEFLFRSLPGEDCPLWTLPDAQPEPAATPLEAAAQARPQVVPSAHKTFRDPQSAAWIDLTAWVAGYGARFEVVSALRTRAPQLLGSRRSGVKQHLECPNAAEHITSATDRTGTYAVNASDLGRAGLPSINTGFVLHCMHAGCAGKDRLDHLHRLLCDGALSVQDLTDPAFLVPEPPTVDASALLQSKATGQSEEAAAENRGNIPSALYGSLPGVMREMHDFICATSPKPQPALNLGAVLAFMAAAVGQRVQLQHWGTRPNLYVLAVAHSGAGKERPLSAIKQMAKSAGLLDTLVGVEEMASDSGIVSSVMRQPRQVMLLDEVSYLIGAVNNKNAATHIANIVGTLLKLYSSSHTVFKGKSYADTDKVRSVDQPCASLYGCSTPAGLYAALTSKDITSGLLSRAVLFDAGDHDPRAKPPAQMPTPAAIVDWLRAWEAVRPIANPLNLDGGDPVIEPRTVMMTAEAQAIVAEFDEEMHRRKVAARKSGTDALYVRAVENALKFALVRACAVLPVKTDHGPAIDTASLCVDAETMRWAVELSKATVTRMEEVAQDEIADTAFQANVKAVRDFIREGGVRGRTQSEISRQRCGKLPERDMKEVFTLLTRANDVFFVTKIDTGKAGRPRDAYVHKRFIRHHVSREKADDLEA